ncbi:MAG TPA: NAD(P)H-binding protein, partial [Candidatus Limnocylindrales bacterium]|nr:NAD(P)H-binding protein [Candidatus Limnocylindrales bacterium]
MRIVVLGASGYVGGRLVTRLLDAGHSVTLMAREPAPLVDRFPAANVMRGDALDPKSLGPALHDAEAIYYLIYAASRGEAGAAGRDLDGARNVAAAAALAGVGRIIYLGGLSAGSRGALESEGDGRSIGDELGGAATPVTEFRTSVIIGSGSASLEIVRHLMERLPVIVLPRWAFTTCQPIGIRDVLDYLVEALRHPDVTG